MDKTRLINQLKIFMNKLEDKKKEIERYNIRAKDILSNIAIQPFEKLPKYLASPYEDYYSKLSYHLNKEKKVLELGSGMGEHSKILVDSGSEVHLSDISKDSLNVLKKRFNNQITSHIADMEDLPFENESFDLICSAGSLSYGDHLKVRNEIYRLLKNDGIFICVDSLNHNFIYKINRYRHYLMNRRTESVIKRTPDFELFKLYQKIFFIEEINFFGSLTWLKPILSFLIGINNFSKFSNWFDKFFKIKKSAFKFVLVARKIKKR